MRIIAGKKRGLKLETLTGKNTRPTMDRVRESLFSILGGECQDLTVLDLFAGSGSLGLEALSRNAKRVVLVEHNSEAFEVVRKNGAKMNAPSQIEIVQKDARLFLRTTSEKYDLIFLDPPYQNDILNDALEMLQTHCKTNARLVIETDGTYPLVIPSCYKIESTRQYGRVLLTIIRFEEK